MRQCISVLGVSLLALAALAAQTPTLPTGTARVTGVVVDQAGVAVAGATVSVRGEKREQGPQVTTGADGRFVLDSLPAIPLSIDAAKAGLTGAYGRKRRTGSGLPLTPGAAAAAEIRIVLWPFGMGTAVITGRVISERGEPIAGVVVRALSAPGSRAVAAGPETPATFTTSDRGVYSVSLPAGTYILQALTAGTHVPAPRGVPRSSPMTRSMINNPRTPDVAFLTDPDGAFVYFPRVTPPAPDRDNRARAYATGFVGGATPRDATPMAIAAGETRTAADLTLRAVRGVSLGGIVTGPRGPVEGATIRLVPRFMDDIPPSALAETASAGKDGRFEFVLVAAGTYALDGSQRLPALEVHLDPRGLPEMGQNDYSLIDNDALWLRQPIDVDADRADLALTLAPGMRVTARMAAENGAPIAAAALQNTSIRFEAVRPTEPGSGAASRTLEPGRFALQAKPGSYVLRANPPRGLVVSSVRRGREDITDHRITIGADPITEELIVTVSEPAQMTGTVTNGAGQPAADATVVLFPADRVAWNTNVQSSPRFRTSRTTTGQYTIDNLPPGAYLIAVVDDAELETWPDASLFQRLSGIARPLTIVAGPNAAPALILR